MTTQELKEKAGSLRETVFRVIHAAGGGHFGGSLSVIEILTVLYYEEMRGDPGNPSWAGRDRFILGKGHAGPALYAVLADKGYFPKERLAELDMDGGSLPKHVDRLKVTGIEYSSGPLGIGISVANGMAKAAKLDGADTRIYLLMGDGECDEGEVWEGAMTAAHYHLDNLLAVVDRNRCQIDGDTCDVMELEPFAGKWKSFGWNVLHADGHDIDSLKAAFAGAKTVKGAPTVVIADTVKGKGISFMENNYLWHSGSLTEEQFQRGLRDLAEARA